MKKISLLMLLAFSVITFGASAQTKPAAKSVNHTTVVHSKPAVKKHVKKHAKKHRKHAAKK